MTTVISSKDEALKSNRAAKRRASRSAAPAEDEIRVLAFYLYQQRQADGGRGDATSDWMEAERRLSDKAES